MPKSSVASMYTLPYPPDRSLPGIQVGLCEHIPLAADKLLARIRELD